MDENQKKQLGPSISADELLRCSRCGYCTSVCPTYRISRAERAVARGRNELVRQMADGRIERTAAAQGPVFDCLLCGACTTVCFGGVRTAELMVQARHEWGAPGAPAVARSAMFREVLTRPARMDVLMRLLRTAERSRIPEALEAIGALRLISPGLSQAQSMVSRLPTSSFREAMPSLGFERVDTDSGAIGRLDSEADGPRVLYFPGCATNYILPRQAEAAVRLLSLAGCQVSVARNCCCGMPAYAHGDLDGAAMAAETNLQLLPFREADYLVCDCATCGSFIKKWPGLLADRGKVLPSGFEGLRVMDLGELLVELGSLPQAPDASSVCVTFHDPCHLVRGQGIADQPRLLLRDLGGAELIEMRESDWCCGGAGSYGITHPDMSRAILGRKMSRATETGAESLLTACPGCVLQLRAGTEAVEAPLEVLHVSEFLCRRMGIELHDWGRKVL